MYGRQIKMKWLRFIISIWYHFFDLRFFSRNFHRAFDVDQTANSSKWDKLCSINSKPGNRLSVMDLHGHIKRGNYDIN